MQFLRNQLPNFKNFRSKLNMTLLRIEHCTAYLPHLHIMQPRYRENQQLCLPGYFILGHPVQVFWLIVFNGLQHKDISSSRSLCFGVNFISSVSVSKPWPRPRPWLEHLAQAWAQSWCFGLVGTKNFDLTTSLSLQSFTFDLGLGFCLDLGFIFLAWATTLASWYWPRPHRRPRQFALFNATGLRLLWMFQVNRREVETVRKGKGPRNVRGW